MNRLSPTGSCLLALGALVALTAAAPAGPATTPPPPKQPIRNIGGPGDYGLRERLIHSLSRDPDVKGANLTVILVNGGVVFSGSAPNWAVRRRALVIAGTEVGIINVTDQMDVPRGSVTDEDIQKAITGLLTDMKDTLGLKDLQVRVEDSIATLTGVVTNFRARVQAEETAGTVLGASRVVNRLRPLTAPSGTDDASIRHGIARFLQDFHEYQFSGDFEIQVKDGRATIGGRVPLYVARQQATNMTALVGGVREVVNRIEIDPSIQMRAGVTVKELP